jgi:MarR family transcriptional regulator, organic hydroperoxide resistance regulator
MAFHVSTISRFHSSYDVLGYVLRLVSALWHRSLNAELAAIDLTEMQFVLLLGLAWLVEAQPDGVTQRELADACSCSAALASQVMQSLARKKLVDVSAHARDSRARVLRLSREGEAKVTQAVAILDRVDRDFWADDPALAADLADVLKRVIELKLGKLPQGAAMPGL